MITTAGNGPAPSGFKSLTGTCSVAPLGVVVAMDELELVTLQPVRNKKASTSNVIIVGIVRLRESQALDQCM
jgi:hypothetical protein